MCVLLSFSSCSYAAGLLLLLVWSNPFFSSALLPITQLGCNLSGASVEALAARLPPTLEVLSLGNNPLGDEGVVALAASLPSTLSELYLYGTYFR